MPQEKEKKDGEKRRKKRKKYRNSKKTIKNGNDNRTSYRGYTT